MSSSSSSSFPPSLKTVTIEPKGSWALVTLNRPPVNGMNLQVWSDLLAALDACEKQQTATGPKGLQGVIFQSGLTKDVFTAGNDITELYGKTTNEKRFKTFWQTKTSFLSRLYRSPLATVAAIRGSCPAGGCIFAMCCDARVMASDVPGSTIGLNEVALGIAVPRHWGALFIRVVGVPLGEELLMCGRMLTAQEALECRLVSKLAPKADLLSVAEKSLQAMLCHPPLGRITTKMDARLKHAQVWMDEAEDEANRCWDALNRPEVIASIGAVLAKLSSGSSAAPKAKL